MLWHGCLGGKGLRGFVDARFEGTAIYFMLGFLDLFLLEFDVF